MADSYGYRYGARSIIKKPLDSTSAAITAGDILTLATAGYLKEATDGDDFHGVAVESSASPDSDGDLSILVDVSQESVYEYPPDTGTVTAALAGTTMDVGAARSINIDASATDNVKVHRADVDANTVYVSFVTDYPGVA